MARVITIDLSKRDSVEQAIRELEAFQKEVERKCEKLRSRLADEIRNRAQSGYDSALGYSVVPKYGRGEMFHGIDITVTSEDGANFSVVLATGDQVAFLEFGTGVAFNGAAGTSPHPRGMELLDMKIGEYGLGNGKRKIWGYYDGTELVMTRGIPASQSLYNATVEVAGIIQNIAREVFQ